MKLSDHFTLDELIASQTAARRGIKNQPDAAIMDNLVFLAGKLEIVREILGNRPMLISSGYRSPELNVAVGGSKTSAHMTGLAADFICPGFGDPLEICQCLSANAKKIGFDQIIQEGTWVHIGFSAAGRQPRLQVLTAQFDKSSTTYINGLQGA